MGQTGQNGACAPVNTQMTQLQSGQHAGDRAVHGQQPVPRGARRPRRIATWSASGIASPNQTQRGQNSPPPASVR